MTISYHGGLIGSYPNEVFRPLLLRWRGSIYKLVYRELLLYSLTFAALSATYRHLLDSLQRQAFEKACRHCATALEHIPLPFVLGFYVTYVVTRWWNQFSTLPWPDRLAQCIFVHLDGWDDRSRQLRLTMTRYVNLSGLLLFQSISRAVNNRFPDTQSLVQAGFLTTKERELLDSVRVPVNKHFVPMVWFLSLAKVASREGRLQHPSHALQQLTQEVCDFRTKAGQLWNYAWVPVPLAYAQVATLATHLYFCTCLLGRQYLDPRKDYPDNDLDLFVPIFTCLQFLFFVGWLKVAEELLTPFGENDDALESNWLLDRNLQVSYQIADGLDGSLPDIQKTDCRNAFSVRAQTESPELLMQGGKKTQRFLHPLLTFRQLRSLNLGELCSEEPDFESEDSGVETVLDQASTHLQFDSTDVYPEVSQRSRYWERTPITPQQRFSRSRPESACSFTPVQIQDESAL